MAKILIIEPDEILAGLYAQKLTDFGFETRTARTEDEARQHLDSFHPDVVTTDHQPGEDLLGKPTVIFLNEDRCPPGELARQIKTRLVRNRLLGS
jgi:DNA-binding response OmpR family regulator